MERKRHLGNDVVVIVFFEGDGEFDPSAVKSQFNHIWIVVAVDGSSIPELGKVRYRVTVCCKNDVPRWEPLLPYPPVFDRDDALRQFLLYKCVNGERAALTAPVFHSKVRWGDVVVVTLLHTALQFTKTNTAYLKKLVEAYHSDKLVVPGLPLEQLQRNE